eukprot:GDKH01000526.1.p2 GENE.GDKH01000526.1~~GDKH01000526.1.p2  ORF type:complete len:121 (-),score=29.46 GDKH01000526.1:85-447(-)
MSVGVPIKLLHEGLGHTVTIELKTGELYRGVLATCEDSMNCLMENVTVTGKDGKLSTLEQVFLRGSQIRFILFPDMLRHAPVFKAVLAKSKGKGLPVSTAAQKKAAQMRSRASHLLRGKK